MRPNILRDYRDFLSGWDLRLLEVADLGLAAAATLAAGLFDAAGFALVGARLEPAVLAGALFAVAVFFADAFGPPRGGAAGLPSRSAISSRA